MSERYTSLFRRAIENILSHLPSSSSSVLEMFAKEFYAKVPASDLDMLNASEASAIAASAFEFARERASDAPKIRIFTPNAKTDGWSSHRVVIEIISDDRPFIVDSILAELSRQGLRVHAYVHPILRVERDSKGVFHQLSDKGKAESFLHFELSPLPETITAESLAHDLTHVLEAVRFAVEDWSAITQKLDEALASLAHVKGFAAEEVSEVADFLVWLKDNHFIFLGHVEYDFFTAGEESLSVVEGSSLGIFKLDHADFRPQGLEALPPQLIHLARNQQLIEITKSNRKSVVHRPVPMDYINLKRFDASGKVVGETRFLGLFTSTVYYQSAADIPIIRRKIARTMERSGFEKTSHDGKTLKTILEFLPRDEIFQMNEDELFECSIGILSLEARPAVRLFARQDAYERFISCMVFVPRERFSTYQREQIQRILEQSFGGTVAAYYTQVTDSPLARLHVIIKTLPGAVPDVDYRAVEAQIATATNLWTDSLLQELKTQYGVEKAESLFRRYENAFPKMYYNVYEASQAVHDMDKMEEALDSGHLSLEIFRKKGDPNEEMHLKLYNPREQLPLSDVLPMLENFGFRVMDENPFLITPKGTHEIWIRDFRLRFVGKEVPDLTVIKPLFEEALSQVWTGAVENDGFNALVMIAGLTAREVVMIRAYAKYMKQMGFAYSQATIEKALATHASLARMLVALFHERFKPAEKLYDAQKEKILLQALEEQLAAVTNLTEDRIIRRFMALMLATLRTNYYQQDAEEKPKLYLSFKFSSAQVPELPKPIPYAEIFVYATDVEGIHLRGGKVARGGLRWSDRREDFRTEVLGLMKAQMVKNAVIVPVGSKGGFVLKNPLPATREALMEEGIRCYKLFLRGLLDLTDNSVQGEIIHPPHVRRHDGDDPYLVVAADKGTATFSNYANAVSKEYGFWLGDAFASGGSAGYDHKAMGITAKGGWISVERHFAEMDVDMQRANFTVAGIGDMAGDVFGNGMLLSQQIQLVAAFNHMHIFLDPNPDASQSFAERARLFALPRSSWADYDASLISKGGGVFDRSAKTIPVSPEVRARLGITESSLAPDDLIKAILMAPVDLLWNGGIGTYVKAEVESHEQVGDRTNNAVRVNGKDLRCKVVGEGGNLGFTQKGRIEYALAGGRINTDAIDNSAGVDCSDHEVNIKIALGMALHAGKITLEERDAILATMTDEVALLVLRDNFLQTQAISIAQSRGASLLDTQARFIRSLEKKGLLDRAVEYLPAPAEIQQRKVQKTGLTRPELAVLLAYGKMSLYNEILASHLPDDAYYVQDLLRYFPELMRERFREEIENHPLRREIIATFVTNSVVNRAGFAFFQGIAQDTGMEAAHVARAYTVARDAFQLRPIWMQIEGSAGHVSAQTRAEMFIEVNRFVGRTTLWLMYNFPQPLAIGQVMEDYLPGIQELKENITSYISGPVLDAFNLKLQAMLENHVPEALARSIASLEALSSACDIVKVARACHLPVAVVAQLYFTLGERLQLGWLRQKASRIAFQNYWERLAMLAIIDDLYEQQRRLTSVVIAALGKDVTQIGAFEHWEADHKSEIERFHHFLADLETVPQPDIPMLTVATRNVKSLCAV